MAGYLGSMLGLVLGTLRLPLVLVVTGWLGAHMTDRFSEVDLRRALGVTLVVVGGTFVAEAVR